MSDPEKYAELFANEAREYLAEIGRALVDLEARPDDRASLDDVFRYVHTLKGMAAAMGYESASRLAHTLESALDPVRAGEREIDPAFVDLLLHAADVLEEAVEAAVAGEPGPDPESVIEALEGAAEPQGARGRGRRTDPSRPAEMAAPATSRGRSRSSRVRVDIRRLDNLLNLIGELVIVRSRLESLAAGSGSESLTDAVDRASRLIGRIQAEVLESRMVPVWQVFDRFPRAVRDTARSLGKEVDLVITGKELELDRSLLDTIADPLIHLLRNAVDHGIELPEERQAKGKPRAGRIELAARRERSRVLITVTDDGRGVDRLDVIDRARDLGLVHGDEELSDGEVFRILARPGFSTRGEVTALSGRGVGLDVVEECVRRCGGSVQFRSAPERGTTVSLELPLTLAIVRALRVEVAGEEYALPTTYARESFRVSNAALERAHGREWVTWRDDLVPVTRLPELFRQSLSPATNGTNGTDGTQRPEQAAAGEANGGPSAVQLIALEAGGERLAISVDRILGEGEVVVKSFDPPRGTLPMFSGATVRPDGRPVLILDVGSLS